MAAIKYKVKNPNAPVSMRFPTGASCQFKRALALRRMKIRD